MTIESTRESGPIVPMDLTGATLESPNVAEVLAPGATGGVEMPRSGLRADFGVAKSSEYAIPVHQAPLGFIDRWGMPMPFDAGSQGVTEGVHYLYTPEQYAAAEAAYYGRMQAEWKSQGTLYLTGIPQAQLVTVTPAQVPALMDASKRESIAREMHMRNPSGAPNPFGTPPGRM
jgi:hypothetical protein